MAKAHRKAQARLQMRQAHHDSLGAGARGRKRPGSNKKSQPLGRKR